MESFQSRTYQRTEQKSTEQPEYFKESYAGLKSKSNWNCSRWRFLVRHSMAKVIQSFHHKITDGPEYICTRCVQLLWYRSSVSKCNSSKYSGKCSQSLLEECITCTKIVDKTEWICSTCHSNLTEGKLPACPKANKMQLPERKKNSV